MKTEHSQDFAKQIILELIKNGKLKPLSDNKGNLISFATTVKTLYEELVNQLSEDKE